MTVRRNLDQERAAAAWAAVQTVTRLDPTLQKEYRALARGFASRIQLNGMGAACAFLYAKSKPDAANDKKEQTVHATLLGHLQTWLTQTGRFPALANQSFIEWLIEASSDEYRRAAVEALAYLAWLRRFAEGAIAAPKQRDNTTP